MSMLDVAIGLGGAFALVVLLVLVEFWCSYGAARVFDWLDRHL